MKFYIFIFPRYQISNIYYITIDQIKIHPPVQIAKEGMNPIFFCDSNNVLNWTFSGGEFPHNAERRQRGKVLFISNTTLQNEGAYDCQGYDEDDQLFFSQGILKVQSKLWYKIFIYTVNV